MPTAGTGVVTARPGPAPRRLIIVARGSLSGGGGGGVAAGTGVATPQTPVPIKRGFGSLGMEQTPHRRAAPSGSPGTISGTGHAPPLEADADIADCARAGTTTAAGMGAGQPNTGNDGGPSAGADDARAGTQTAPDDLQGTALGGLRLIASQEDGDTSDNEDDDDDGEDDDDDAPQMPGQADGTLQEQRAAEVSNSSETLGEGETAAGAAEATRQVSGGGSDGTSQTAGQAAGRDVAEDHAHAGGDNTGTRPTAPAVATPVHLRTRLPRRSSRRVW